MQASTPIGKDFASASSLTSSFHSCVNNNALLLISFQLRGIGVVFLSKIEFLFELMKKAAE